jgi:hypothetical protein
VPPVVGIWPAQETRREASFSYIGEVHFFPPRVESSFPNGPKGQEAPSGTNLKTNNQFPLSLTILIQKLYVTIELKYYFKFSPITACMYHNLYVENFILRCAVLKPVACVGLVAYLK